jgi:hypothetical protein
MVITFFPAVLILWHKYWKKLASRCQITLLSNFFNTASVKIAKMCTFSKGNHTFRLIDWLFYSIVSPAVHKARWALLVAMVALFGASIALTSQLQPADSLPRFFPSNHNIQKFLDWQLDGTLSNNYDIITKVHL